MQLLETGLFGDFRHLFIAGHPEGNRDIDPDGGEAEVMRALRWKADFAARTDADMQIVTQFAFEAQPCIDWAGRLRAAGIDMPIRIGVAGPAKLQTMLKFAIMCGVGPSLRVLQRRARDVTKLLLPYEPTDFVGALARARRDDPDFPIAAAHVFPLGGIAASTDWLSRARGE
jgi:methylenetetrahydrofolate reductase (NADPH)